MQKSSNKIDKSGKCRVKISLDDVKKIAQKLNINWSLVLFKPNEFRRGMNIELEHGKCIDGIVSPITNVTNDDLYKTGQIAFAHLIEDFRYYDLKLGLPAMENNLKKTKKVAEQLAKSQKNKNRKPIK